MIWIHLALRTLKKPNQALDRMTRSAVSRVFQYERPWRAPRHRSYICVRRRARVRFMPCDLASLRLCVLMASISTQRRKGAETQRGFWQEAGACPVSTAEWERGRSEIF